MDLLVQTSLCHMKELRKHDLMHFLLKVLLEILLALLAQLSWSHEQMRCSRLHYSNFSSELPFSGDIIIIKNVSDTLN